MLGKDGKTEYRFTVSNAQLAEQQIQSWLQANGFSRFEENGAVFYRAGNGVVNALIVADYKFFEYAINGSQVVICAYLGSYNKPKALTDGLTGAIPITAYKNILTPLFVVLNSENNSQQIQQSQSMSNNTYSNFQQSIDKRNDTCAEVSFWISILMFLASLFGISLSALCLIVVYFLAIQGLRSHKRGKAITAIVISSIALIIVIIALITGEALLG